MLSVLAEYKLLLSLGALFLISIPFYIFVDGIRKQDRYLTSKNENDKEVKKPSVELKDEIDEEQIATMEEELEQTVEAINLDFQNTNDEELTRAYRIMKLNLPNVDSLVKLNRLPKEEGQKLRRQMGTVLAMLAERKKKEAREKR